MLRALHGPDDHHLVLSLTPPVSHTRVQNARHSQRWLGVGRETPKRLWVAPARGRQEEHASKERASWLEVARSNPPQPTVGGTSDTPPCPGQNTAASPRRHLPWRPQAHCAALSQPKSGASSSSSYSAFHGQSATRDAPPPAPTRTPSSQPPRNLPMVSPIALQTLEKRVRVIGSLSRPRHGRRASPAPPVDQHAHD